MRRLRTKRAAALFLSAALVLELFGNFGSVTVNAAELFGTAGTEAVPKSGKDVSGGDALQKEKDVFDQGISDTDKLQEADVSGGDVVVGADVSGGDLIGAEAILNSAVLANVRSGETSGRYETIMAMAGKTADTMVIDGNLTEGIWDSADSYSIDYLADFTINNNTGSFAAVWDDTNFYIGITILDSDVITKDNGILNDHDNIYLDDGVEIYIDPDNSRGEKFDRVNDTQIMIRHDGEMKVCGYDAAPWEETHALDGKIQKAVTVVPGTGFTVEVAIPWDAFGVSPEDGMVLGLDVGNDDNDSYTGNARKEITWTDTHTYNNPSSWGIVCLYDTRKPVISACGTPFTLDKTGAADASVWDAEIWNFSDEYSLEFTGIPGAELKFASLSDADHFYLGMLIEGAGSAFPGVEVLMSGDNRRSGARGTYSSILQWNPCAAETWRQMNITASDKTGLTVTRYNLGNGSYAVVVRYPWELLTEAGVNGDTVENEGGEDIVRRNYSEISFSLKTGNMSNPDSNFSLADPVYWVPFNAWAGEALKGLATLLINNSNLMPRGGNTPPAGTEYYSYSVQQGGSVSGKVNVTDADEGDVLSYSLEGGFDTAKGTVVVDSVTGEWTYTAPDSDFVTEGAASISFWIAAADQEGAAHRTRIEVKVEYKPTNLTYYVDGDTGSDGNDGLSHDTALRTLAAAHDKTKPGDTVLIYGSDTPYGWYSDEEYGADESLYKTVRNGVLVITRSGLPDAPITYKAAEGENPVISGNSVWNNLVISANYIVIEGLTVRGISDERSYEDAFGAFWGKMAAQDDPEYIAGWDQAVGAYNTNGITVEPASGRKMTADGAVSEAVSIPHHVTISNCVSELLSGTGIGGSQCDYVTIDNCTVVNNCWWGIYGNSGISFNETVDIDDNAGDYKIVIRDNISAGNRHFMPWKAGTVRLSDGNGIIMDTCDEHAYNYQGKTLIANNLVYENGGSGIHTFRCDNVDIVNNTLFNNNATVELADWGEVFANDALNVGIYNNIVYSRSGSKESPGTSTFDYNLFYNFNEITSNFGSNAGNNIFNVNPGFADAVAIVHMPEGFDVDRDYSLEWYTEKTAAAGINPNKWTMAANAAAAGWYPEADYDVFSYGYDFKLSENSPAIGAANSQWQTIAGGAGYDNTIGIFSKVGPVASEKPEEPKPEEPKPEEPKPEEPKPEEPKPEEPKPEEPKPEEPKPEEPKPEEPKPEEPKPEEPKPEEPKPEEPKPEEPKPGEPEPTQPEQQPSGTERSVTSPQTGDSSRVVVFMLLIAGVLVAAFTARKVYKKK